MLYELARRQAIERRMGPFEVVISPPHFDRVAGGKDVWEGMFVQELVAKSPVETLDAPVLIWLTRFDEVERDVIVA